MADDYIKREDAITALENLTKPYYKSRLVYDRTICAGINTALREVQSISAADVVEVVRCKDCKHNRGVTTDLWGNDAIECDVFGECNPLDWFCAAGERENNDDKLL